MTGLHKPTINSCPWFVKLWSYPMGSGMLKKAKSDNAMTREVEAGTKRIIPHPRKTKPNDRLADHGEKLTTESPAASNARSIKTRLNIFRQRLSVIDFGEKATKNARHTHVSAKYREWGFSQSCITCINSIGAKPINGSNNKNASSVS